MEPISIGRENIARADADVLARKLVEAIAAKGGTVELLGLHPTPRGLVVVARIYGTDVAVCCWSFNVIDYHAVADALMVEYHKGLNPPFPEDADMIGLHRSN